MKILKTDITLIGGGMVGLSMALALAESGLSVCLVDNQKPGPESEPEKLPCSPRVSALTPASIHWLEDLGVWQRIDEQQRCYFNNMQVWDGEGTGSIHFDAADIYADALGAIVENSRVTLALEETLDGSGVLILRPDALAAMPEPGRLVLESGQEIQTRLVIGADGGRSLVRSLGEFRVREWAYPHKAIVTTVATEKPHASTAWQRFMTTGPLAFLPLNSPAGDSRNLASIVWSCEPGLCEDLMALDDAAFKLHLGEAFEHRLGEVLEVNRRFAFPLQQMHAVDYVKPGIALIGDAAHTIHPLAGQGVNLGLQDARTLTEVIQHAVQAKENFAHLQVLSRYQRQRKAENLGMMVSMEGFSRLFSSRDIGVTWLRNAGMTAFNKQSLIRKNIMRKAMGLR